MRLFILIFALFAQGVAVAEDGGPYDRPQAPSTYDQGHQIFLDKNRVPLEPVEITELQDEEKWIGSGFAHPEFYLLENLGSNKKYSHEFDMTAIIFRKAGWSRSAVVRRLEKVAEVYLNCHVNLSRLLIAIVNAPENRVDLIHDGRNFDKTPGTKYHLATITPSVTRPLMYFIGSFNDGTTGTSARDQWALGTAQENATWVASEVQTKEYKASRGPNFSTEAHELGHVLLNRGHYSGEGLNIMSVGPMNRNDRFNSEQCEKIRSHRLIRERESFIHSAG